MTDVFNKQVADFLNIKRPGDRKISWAEIAPMEIPTYYIHRIQFKFKIGFVFPYFFF